MPRQSKVALLDTNVLLRFLLGDDPIQSPCAENLMKRLERKKERAELAESVVAETVWVLEKAIGVPRPDIALHLASIIEIPGVVCRNKRVVLDALSSFSATGCDIVDCLLASSARNRGAKVYSFDADFAKLGCAFEAPR